MLSADGLLVLGLVVEGSWLSAGSLLHLLLFLSVCLHCLRYRRDADSTLLWIVISWSLPFVGPALYAAFGVYRVQRKGWQKECSNRELLSARQTHASEILPLSYWQGLHDAVAGEPSSSLARELNRVMDPLLPDYPLLGGNDVQPLVTGDEAYPLMLDSIRSAQHHVHLQSFIIGNDRVGRQFLELLAEKAGEGVAIRLLYDSFGSTHAFFGGLFRKYRGIKNFQLCGWTQANLFKRQFQFNLRNHRKLLVVDGRSAFAGGVNLSESEMTHDGAPAIRDYHFAIRGPIVRELQYSFMRDWYYMTDENPEALLQADHFPVIAPQGTAYMRLVNGGPSSEMETIADVLFTCIAMARKQLLAVTPYFVPTVDILRALRVAALRGVDVRLVVPKENNHFYAGLAGKALYEELLTAGVHIFERQPPFIHSKALIVDDVTALAGTANLDVRSLRLNYETNLVIHDDVLVNRLKGIILGEIALSTELNLHEWRQRSKGRRLMENFCSLLTPIL
ncbi:MAG TPA: cardiolipin synthase [Verrucomicrobia bacterium]|nr:MAG: cardiolipin synthase [Lentisphaerae bacterium GWF2_57_35]HBA82666.1 cardiolipin synthase [Verrucomicrobiota bacterium]